MKQFLEGQHLHREAIFGHFPTNNPAGRVEIKWGQESRSLLKAPECLLQFWHI